MGKNYVFVDDLSPQDIEADVASQTVRLRREAGTTPIQGYDKILVRQNDELFEVAFDSIDAALNDLVYREATTFEVGAGKPYSSINQVLNILRDKILVSNMLIKVADGIYDYNSIDIYRHPYAHKIRIEGNVANPANCVIRWIPDAAGNSHGVLINGCSGINISGFKFLGSSTESNWTYRSLFIGDKSSFYSDDNSLMFEGGVNGIEMFDYAQIHASRIRFSNIAGTAMRVARLASGWIPNAVISGAGKNASVTIPARHNGGVLNPLGIWLTDNANVIAGGAVISNLRYGIISARGAHTEASLIDVSDCDYGIWATNGGVILAIGGKATGCDIGYQSTAGGLLIANDTSDNSTGNTVKYDVDANSKLIWS